MEFSYQLYSSRDFPPWEDVFALLHDAGYTQVEGFGPLYENLDQTAAALDRHQLTMPTAHFALDLLEQNPGRDVEIAKTLGINAIYCPYLAPELRPTDAAGYVALGARVEQAGQACVDAGLVYGWHNHDFEFQPLEDGTMPIDHMFEGGPTLGWQADLAWILRAGADPALYLPRYADRISAVHLKDIAPAGENTDEDGWADVGQGTVDWHKLMPLVRQTSALYYIIEHDNPSDHQRFATRSIDFLRRLTGL